MESPAALAGGQGADPEPLGAVLQREIQFCGKQCQRFQIVGFSPCADSWTGQGFIRDAPVLTFVHSDIDRLVLPRVDASEVVVVAILVW
ncbi:hypothetical protein D3C84_1186670 [compost metagenome]